MRLQRSLIWNWVVLLLAAPAQAQVPASAPDPTTAVPTVENQDSGLGADDSLDVPEKSTNTRDWRPEMFADLWEKRRNALALSHSAEADAFTKRLLESKEQAGWPMLVIFGQTMSREAERAARRGQAKQALNLANDAVRLAPTIPLLQATLARTQVQNGMYWQAVKSYARYVTLIFSDPPIVRQRLGRWLLAISLSVWLATIVLAFFSMYRHLPVLIHDVKHLLPKYATYWQAVIATLAFLTAPIVFRLGVAWTVVLWFATLGIYFGRRERLGAMVALIALAAVIAGLPLTFLHLSYPASRSYVMARLARELDAEPLAASLSERSDILGDELYVLGLRARWSGNYERAVELLQRAAQKGVDDAELFTALGTLRFLQSADEEDSARVQLVKQEAITWYKKALERDPQAVVAYFNMSRVYYSLAEHQKAGQAYRDAAAIDYEWAEQFAQRAKRSGPTMVANEDVPRRLLWVPIDPDTGVQTSVRRTWGMIGGRTKRESFVIACFVVALLFLVVSPFRLVLKPSRSCVRCGRPVCRRCYPQLQLSTQCGACFQSFEVSEVADARLRIQKELEAFRYQNRTARLQRLLSVLLAGGGQLLKGSSLKGVFYFTSFILCLLVALTNFDVLPWPTIIEDLLPSFSFWPALVIGVIVYVASLLDLQRDQASS